MGEDPSTYRSCLCAPERGGRGRLSLGPPVLNPMESNSLRAILAAVWASLHLTMQHTGLPGASPCMAEAVCGRPLFQSYYELVKI